MDHQTLLKKIDQLTIKKIDTSIENLEKATSDFLQAGAKYGERKIFSNFISVKRETRILKKVLAIGKMHLKIILFAHLFPDSPKISTTQTLQKDFL